MASVNSDLALLSSLLGRKVTLDDLPELTKAFGIPSTRSTASSVLNVSPSHNEVFEAAGPGSDKTRVKSEIDSGSSKVKPQTFEDTYGKTDDALLATLLKQNGIGPANNNIPVQMLLHQIMGAASTPFSRSTNPTSPRPIANSTARRPRPIIDGLAWLWRTWQETDPKRNKPTNGASVTLAGTNPNGEFSAEEYTNEGNSVSSRDRE